MLCVVNVYMYIHLHKCRKKCLYTQARVTSVEMFCFFCQKVYYTHKMRNCLIWKQVALNLDSVGTNSGKEKKVRQWCRFLLNLLNSKMSW